MSEGHVHVDAGDSFGKKVGLLAAVLAVFLSGFTISAHRAHTNTILLTNEASDQWAHYQAKRIRDYQLEMNSDLLKLAAAQNPDTPKMLADYARQRSKYKTELEAIKADAESKAHASEVAHHRAMCFDLAEGVLEIALVLSSLYFLSHKKFFPGLGLAFGLIGLAVGLSGYFIR